MTGGVSHHQDAHCSLWTLEVEGGIFNNPPNLLGKQPPQGGAWLGTACKVHTLPTDQLLFCPFNGQQYLITRCVVLLTIFKFRQSPLS